VSRSLIADSLVPVYAGRAGDTARTITAEQAAGRLVVFTAPLGANGLPTGVYAAVAADAVARFPTAAAIAIASLDFITPAAANSLRAASAGLSGSDAIAGPAPAGILLSAPAAEKIFGARLDSVAIGTAGRPVAAKISFVDRPVEAAARNVVALLRGSDPKLRGQIIAIGAHSDHLGIARVVADHDSLRAFDRVMRPEGAQTPTTTPTPEQSRRIRTILDSLRRIRPPRADSIFNGADDDGSGSVAALEIAESLVASARPRRSILFVWHTAEEANLLGSGWFTDHPTVPRDSIVAQINMDQMGRGEPVDNPTGGPNSLVVIGARRLSTELGDLAERVNAKQPQAFRFDYSFDKDGDPTNAYCRSDHYMYARYGIPVVFFSAAAWHVDYHMVSDEPQYIAYDRMARIGRYIRDVVGEVADLDRRPVVDKAKPDPDGLCKQ